MAITVDTVNSEDSELLFVSVLGGKRNEATAVYGVPGPATGTQHQ